MSDEQTPQPLVFHDKDRRTVLLIDPILGCVTPEGVEPGEVFKFFTGLLQGLTQEAQASYERGYNTGAGEMLRRTAK